MTHVDRLSRLSAVVAPAALAVWLAWPVAAQPPSQPPSQAPRRFVIDSHQHWRDDPAYIDTLVKTYRPRNAMACVLTPVDGLEAVKQAAGETPGCRDPLRPGRTSTIPRCIAQIERFAKAGFKGIKMHRPKYDWDTSATSRSTSGCRSSGWSPCSTPASSPATRPASPSSRRWRACGRRFCTRSPGRSRSSASRARTSAIRGTTRRRRSRGGRRTCTSISPARR